MTVIAYARGVLACDSAVTDNDVCVSKLKKIYRLSSGALFGYAGDADVRALMALLDKVRTVNKLPTAKEIAAIQQDQCALLILPRGIIVGITIDHEKSGWYGQAVVTNRAIAAIGAGADFALGAMAAGKSAREAVALTCNWIDGCRLPVHSFDLTPGKKAKLEVAA